MKSRKLLFVLAVVGAGIGAAQAAPAVTAEQTAPPAAKHPANVMDRVHERVVFSREAEQRRWIEDGLQRGRLSRTQAAALWNAAADLAREQALLTQRGHETTDEALALSHRQDLLDWMIRTGEVAYEPQALRAMG